MGSFTVGDIFFILVVFGIIFGILKAVNRSRTLHVGTGGSAPETAAGDDQIREILSRARVIALAGISENSAALQVRAYLEKQGYETVSLDSDGPISLDFRPDIVGIFGSEENAPKFAERAVAMQAGTLWLEEGVNSLEAMRIAREGGLEVVMNRGLAYEHRRLTGNFSKGS